MNDFQVIALMAAILSASFSEMETNDLIAVAEKMYDTAKMRNPILPKENT